MAPDLTALIAGTMSQVFTTWEIVPVFVVPVLLLLWLYLVFKSRNQHKE